MENKLIRGVNSNPYEKQNSFQFLKIGVVIDDADEFSLGRLRIRIKGSQSSGGDDGISDTNLPFSYPLLPKHIQVFPKKGESVWVLIIDKNKRHVDRLFLGPITSQLDKLNYDDGKTTGLSGLSFGVTTPNLNTASIPEIKGVFPDKSDISIQGRYNTDITQKKNEIVIRVGKFVKTEVSKTNPYTFSFNKKTQGFIQLKNDVNIGNENGSVINIVSNKINLLTHKNGTPNFNLLNQENLINDKEMEKILSEAHQVPFGDVLIEYLKLLKEALFSHVHNGNGNPATDLNFDGNKKSLAFFKSKSEELENSMLSKNIRIN